jgi:VanZ family protein
LLGLSWFKGLEKRIKQPFLTGFVSVMAAIGYAAIDEFHQSFTGGRTPLFQDVMLDGCGALTIVLILIIKRLLSKKKY